MHAGIRKIGAFVVAGALVASLALSACSSSSSDDTSGEASYSLLNDGVITFATSPDFPPFENLDDNGDYVGLDIEIAKAVADQLGLECEFVTLQFDAIIPAIAAGGQADAGISGFTVDPERAEQIDFSDTYYTDNLSIAVMGDSEITSDNVDEMLNDSSMIIAVQTGTTGETYAQENFPNATTQGYGNSTDAFAAMASGQADAVITNSAVVEQMLADAYSDANIVSSIATGEEYAIVVSKDNPELTEAINEALANLQADGTIDDLIAEYL